MKIFYLSFLTLCVSLGCTSSESPSSATGSLSSRPFKLTKASFEHTVSVDATRDNSGSKREIAVIVEYGPEMTPAEEAAIQADQLWVMFSYDLLRAGVRHDAGVTHGGRGINRRNINFSDALVGTGTLTEEWIFDDAEGPLYAVVDYEIWSHGPIESEGLTRLDANSELLFVGSSMALVTSGATPQSP